MITAKKNVFVALLFVALTFNAYSMEPQNDYKKLGWVVLAGAAITGGAVAFNKFLSYIHSEPEAILNFSGLPEEIQGTIIALLAQNSSAKTVQEAGQTINALARTNKSLNKLINNPQFCLQIIKHLAKKFKCSDEKAALALQTKEAKLRLNRQKDFLYGYYFPQNKLYPLDLSLIDLHFTHSAELTNPLIMAALSNNIVMTQYLIDHGVDINSADIDGNTPLMYATMENNKNIVNSLLNAGANPELANNRKHTPLKEAEKNSTQEIINLMQNAISKKHDKDLL